MPREKDPETNDEESDEEVNDKDDKGRRVLRPRMRTLPNGKKIPRKYKNQREMDEAFEDYWNSELHNLRTTHQVYVGFLNIYFKTP